ncbi:MAG: NAD(+)/NADH kinase [Myxococcota bacterium]
MSSGDRERPPKVLVIYKKSTWEVYRRGGRKEHLDQLVAKGDPGMAEVVQAHEDHVTTVEDARRVLKRLGAKAVFRHRWNDGDVKGYDLVVTLGGDGTLLWASHVVGEDTPVLGINSAPRASVGYFCAGDKHGLEETLSAALEGRLAATRLTRMQVDVDDHPVDTRVLNDILFAHVCPAIASRYVLRHRDVEEEQRSSGIWVGPAAGSTAAQRSAGGKVLPLTSDQLQFVVREPYYGMGDPYRLEQGLVEPGESLFVRSRMRDARIYFDGAHRTANVDFGRQIRLTRSPEPLTLLGLRPDAHR